MTESFKKSEKDVKEIVIRNEDGSEEVITKGFVGVIDNEDVAIRFANMAGTDVIKTMEALLYFAANTLDPNHFEGSEEE